MLRKFLYQFCMNVKGIDEGLQAPTVNQLRCFTGFVNFKLNCSSIGLIELARLLSSIIRSIPEKKKVRGLIK
ncbi:hypothetical protein M5K25_014669 [Dendrobium thyrsiflorum]|uniref:Uncharacterized protein n=1 Tax=Dendrobium thyrsiflorum TaxID=117978 RepID=A0ABD0UNC8_DENTH